MNTRPVIETASEQPALSIAFNDDSSRFAVGLDSGFCIFQASKCQVQTARVFNAGLGLVHMMGNANFLALVGVGRSPKFPQNKVIIWDDSKGKVAFEIAALTAVRGVQITKTRVVVVQQNSVRLYAFEKPPKPLAKYETADNLLGLFSSAQTANYLHQRAKRELLYASSRLAVVQNWQNEGEASENATIFSLRFSPSGNMLAYLRPLRTVQRPLSRSPALLASPRVQTQVRMQLTNGESSVTSLLVPSQTFYSFTSCPFETGSEPLLNNQNMRRLSDNAVLGTTRPIKGVIGWIDERSLVVVGAGYDARWEKFILREGEDGRLMAQAQPGL
ncbi:hypothetical protein NPX13_g8824 [Xylaria arbuscula]|uniref:Uncharacterized protein n=1 Tax=Xylaria arbuscula TaxID=114810 RepID=A0A9W8TJ34_9PEZI|nr:hypothetical protein NPX13_g8824 [Xylaria arbuscula]